MGRIGIKVWIYKGEILPPPPEVTEELETIEVRVETDGEDVAFGEDVLDEFNQE
jgi:ribosomal protein S3